MFAPDAVGIVVFVVLLVFAVLRHAEWNVDHPWHSAVTVINPAVMNIHRFFEWSAVKASVHSPRLLTRATVLLIACS